jgi:hypothetical protein
VCEEQVKVQVKNKKRLGWKHGNTPKRFLFWKKLDSMCSFENATEYTCHLIEIVIFFI